MTVLFHLLSICLLNAGSLENTLDASFCFYSNTFIIVSMTNSESEFYAENTPLLFHHPGNTPLSPWPSLHKI